MDDIRAKWFDLFVPSGDDVVARDSADGRQEERSSNPGRELEPRGSAADEIDEVDEAVGTQQQHQEQQQREQQDEDEQDGEFQAKEASELEMESIWTTTIAALSPQKHTLATADDERGADAVEGEDDDDDEDDEYRAKDASELEMESIWTATIAALSPKQRREGDRNGTDQAAAAGGSAATARPVLRPLSSSSSSSLPSGSNRRAVTARAAARAPSAEGVAATLFVKVIEARRLAPQST